MEDDGPSHSKPTTSSEKKLVENPSASSSQAQTPSLASQQLPASPSIAVLGELSPLKESHGLLTHPHFGTPKSLGKSNSYLRQALGSPYQKLNSPYGLEAGGYFRPPLGKGYPGPMSSSPVRLPQTPQSKEDGEFKVPHGHHVFGPGFTPPSSGVKRTPRSLYRAPASPATQGVVTPLSRGVVTPKARIYNPFERGIDHLHHALQFSPNMFLVPSTPSSDDGKSFAWSIDNIAHLKPADIPEIPPHQDWHHGVDPETEERAQQAISHYFSNHLVVPSPWSGDKKQQATNPMLGSFPFSDLDGSIHDNLRSAVPGAAKREAASQTVLSLPKDFDIQAVLGEHMKHSGSAETVASESLSSSSLRRKLFDGDTSSAFLPTEDGFLVDELPPGSDKPVTPEWEHISTPKKTPSSVHFSSSPIITPHNFQSPPDDVFSPHVSPIKHHSVKSRSRFMKTLMFEDLADSPGRAGSQHLASPLLSPIGSVHDGDEDDDDANQAPRGSDFRRRHRLEDQCASPELSPIAAHGSPEHLPHAMSPGLSPVLGEGGRHLQRHIHSQTPKLSPVPMAELMETREDGEDVMRFLKSPDPVEMAPDQRMSVEMSTSQRLSVPGATQSSSMDSLSMNDTPQAVLTRISRSSSEAGRSFLLTPTPSDLSPRHRSKSATRGSTELNRDSQTSVRRTSRARLGFSSQNSSVLEMDTSEDMAPLPNSTAQDTGYQTSSLQLTSHPSLTGPFSSLPFRSDSSHDSAMGGDGDKEEREKDREMKLSGTSISLGHLSSFPPLPDLSQDSAMGEEEGREPIGVQRLFDLGRSVERMDASSPLLSSGSKDVCLTGVRISRERTGPFVLDLKAISDVHVASDEQLPSSFRASQSSSPEAAFPQLTMGSQLMSSSFEGKGVWNLPAGSSLGLGMSQCSTATGSSCRESGIYAPPESSQKHPDSPRSAGTGEMEQQMSRRSSECLSDSDWHHPSDESYGDDVLERAKNAIAMAENLCVRTAEGPELAHCFLDPSQTPPPLRLAAARRKVALMRQSSQPLEPTESQLASTKFREILRQANRDLDDLDHLLQKPGKKS